MTSKKFEQFINERGFAEKTVNLYVSAVNSYTKFCEMGLDDLITEADYEEEAGVRWKRRTIKSRLIAYRKYLFETKSEGTAKQYLARIKTIYRHFEIEMMELPTFNSKQIDKTYEKCFEDIPTKDELIQAYHEGGNVMKCYILFSISSGMSKVDILNLTVDDFLTACYTDKEKTVREQLQEIQRRKEPVIPCFKGTRQKTGTAFTTFASPESVEHITQYLLGRDAKIRRKYDNASYEGKQELPCRLEGSDKMLKIGSDYLVKQFREINNKLSFGTVGKYVKLRSHQLRAYHATTLKNMDEIVWSADEIDALQGRKKSKTHRAYFTESISKLHRKYVDSVDSLMLFKSIHSISPHEFEAIKEENTLYKQKLMRQDEKIEKIIANQRELEALVGM